MSAHLEIYIFILFLKKSVTWNTKFCKCLCLYWRKGDQESSLTRFCCNTLAGNKIQDRHTHALCLAIVNVAYSPRNWWITNYYNIVTRPPSVSIFLSISSFPLSTQRHRVARGTSYAFRIALSRVTLFMLLAFSSRRKFARNRYVDHV